MVVKDNYSVITSSESDIDFFNLLKLISDGKWVIIGITLTFFFFSLIFVSFLPDIYEAEVLLSPVDEEQVGGTNNLLSQIGGVNSFPGLRLGGGTLNKTTKAVETAKSRIFIKNFFETHDLLVTFMASRPVNDERFVEIDPNVYDVNANRWLRGSTSAQYSPPTDWEVYKEFSKILNVTEDSGTGFVRISLEWYDPIQIKQWIDWLVEDLNESMKNQDLIEAEKAVNYLSNRVANTQLVEMRNIFYNLIESQTEIIMLTDIRGEYAFEQIDPAGVSEEKVKPKRGVICFLALCLGLNLGVMLVVFIKYYRSRNALIKKMI